VDNSARRKRPDYGAALLLDYFAVNFYLGCQLPGKFPQRNFAVAPRQKPCDFPFHRGVRRRGARQADVQRPRSPLSRGQPEALIQLCVRGQARF
jgi:hypothetical protein